MGFGLLLIGYFFAYTVTVGLGSYLFAGMLIGGFVMFLGLSELRKYSPAFIYAIIANIALLLLSFCETISWMEPMLGFSIGFSNTNAQMVFDWIKLVVDLAFNIAMLYGIADISRRVDFQETRTKAYRNMVFVGVYNAVQLLMILPIGIFESDKSFFMTLLMFLQLIYTVVNLVLIFRCYAMICPEGEEDMHRKPSRFEFINKIRAKQDEREQQAIESTKAYFEEKLKKKQQKNQSNNKNHHHKKKK